MPNRIGLTPDRHLSSMTENWVLRGGERFPTGSFYLVSGGAGAPLDKNGFNHYLVVSVDGNRISVELVKL